MKELGRKEFSRVVGVLEPWAPGLRASQGFPDSGRQPAPTGPTQGSTILCRVSHKSLNVLYTFQRTLFFMHCLVWSSLSVLAASTFAQPKLSCFGSG